MSGKLFSICPYIRLFKYPNYSDRQHSDIKLWPREILGGSFGVSRPFPIFHCLYCLCLSFPTPTFSRKTFQKQQQQPPSDVVARNPAFWPHLTHASHKIVASDSCPYTDKSSTTKTHTTHNFCKQNGNMTKEG